MATNVILFLKLIISLLLSFTLTIFITKKIIKISLKRNDTQIEREYLQSHIDKKGTPTMGGIAIVLSSFDPYRREIARVTIETLIKDGRIHPTRIEELYDKNIFTNWSGLTGNAHIRIPLDGLSKENFLIAKQNCENNPNHWKLQRPTYKDVKNLLPNYTFEIYVEYLSISFP